ncbi:9626_t:CDS:2 [Ambispora leptoticha]|uniref:9626_t:CDS:1 n=1 Tax=Ambispora leptoticha TaxID=144679 RepID=A0A9N8ZX15_9GLOM|nr:9626_t:CDS:2 [Ambispora leptoticha]
MSKRQKARKEEFVVKKIKVDRIVRKIKGYRINKGILQYLVRWDEYPNSDDSYVDEADVFAAVLVADYWNNKKIDDLTFKEINDLIKYYNQNSHPLDHPLKNFIASIKGKKRRLITADEFISVLKEYIRDDDSMPISITLLETLETNLKELNEQLSGLNDVSEAITLLETNLSKFNKQQCTSSAIESNISINNIYMKIVELFKSSGTHERSTNTRESVILKIITELRKNNRIYAGNQKLDKARYEHGKSVRFSRFEKVIDPNYKTQDELHPFCYLNNQYHSSRFPADK